MKQSNVSVKEMHRARFEGLANYYVSLKVSE